MKSIPRVTMWPLATLVYTSLVVVEIEAFSLQTIVQNYKTKRIRNSFLNRNNFSSIRQPEHISILLKSTTDETNHQSSSGKGPRASSGPKAAGRRRPERRSTSSRSGSSQKRSSMVEQSTASREADPSSVDPIDKLPESNSSSNNGVSKAESRVGPKASGRRRGERSSSSAGTNNTRRSSSTSDRRTGPRQRRESSAVGPKSSTGPRSSGPRSAGPRPSRRSSRTPSSNGVAVVEKSGKAPPQPERQPRSSVSPTPQEPFDGKLLTSRQTSNPQAPKLDLRVSLDSQQPSFRCVTPGIVQCQEDVHRPPSPFVYKSLDDLLSWSLAKQGIIQDVPTISLSRIFNSNATFRTDLRNAIRLDVFETTPFYANLPAKAKTVLLLPDSSLEGSWRKQTPEQQVAAENSETTEKQENEKDDDPSNLNQTTTLDEDTPSIPTPVQRMKHTTQVLNRALREHTYANNTNNDQPNEDSTNKFRFTGDDLFEAIGSICGDGASTHWIDIYGVQDRKVSHGWHLDAGRSPQNCQTVLWGFPPEDHYRGTGVFSHIVSLQDPFGSTLGFETEEEGRERPRMEPVLFDGTPGEEYVFRPLYEEGKELLIYRDIDVLHSAPDIAYRTSVMRFM